MSDYIVVEDTNKGDFERRVKTYLESGYEPVGAMSAETEDGGFFGPIFPDTTYRQALLKK